QGVGPGDHVGLYLQNCAEYLEAMLAAFKLRAVPVNVNYRYVRDELRYLLTNSDSMAIVTQPSLADRVDALRSELPGLRFVLTPGSLDPAAVWATVAAEGVQSLTVVGDAVARPLLDEWDRAGGYEVPSLFAFSNGGAPMSTATKERVFATLPHVLLADGFGS